MAPLPQNNTARVFLDYSGVTGAHTTMLRLLVNTGPDEGLEVAQAFWSQAVNILTQDVVDATVRYSAQGSNFSLPVGTATGTGLGAPNQPDANDAMFTSFIGRTIEGRRTRITLFNVFRVPDGDFRVSGESLSTAEAAILNYLENDSRIVGIDGERVVWKPYLNTGWSAYYQRLYRRTR